MCSCIAAGLAADCGSCKEEKKEEGEVEARFERRILLLGQVSLPWNQTKLGLLYARKSPASAGAHYAVRCALIHIVVNTVSYALSSYTLVLLCSSEGFAFINFPESPAARFFASFTRPDYTVAAARTWLLSSWIIPHTQCACVSAELRQRAAAEEKSMRNTSSVAGYPPLYITRSSGKSSK